MDGKIISKAVSGIADSATTLAEEAMQLFRRRAQSVGGNALSTESSALASSLEKLPFTAGKPLPDLSAQTERSRNALPLGGIAKNAISRDTASEPLAAKWDALASGSKRIDDSYLKSGKIEIDGIIRDPKLNHPDRSSSLIDMLPESTSFKIPELNIGENPKTVLFPRNHTSASDALDRMLRSSETPKPNN